MDINLITQNLKTRWCGKKIHYLPSVDSTNLWANKSIASEERGTVFLTDYQTAGRGRLNRRWESPAGKNILLSLIDSPPHDPAKINELTLVVGVAFVSGLSALFPGLPFGLKWPNDILLDGKKMGGVLSEYDPRIDKMLIGVGININAEEKDFSSEVLKMATSLRIQTGEPSPREPIIATCLSEHEKWRALYDREGLRTIIPAWNERAVHLHKKIRVVDEDISIEGICEGLDGNGFLVVNENGQKHTIITGDVILL